MLRARRGDRENNHPVPPALLRTPTPQNALSPAPHSGGHNYRVPRSSCHVQNQDGGSGWCYITGMIRGKWSGCVVRDIVEQALCGWRVIATLRVVSTVSRGGARCCGAKYRIVRWGGLRPNCARAGRWTTLMSKQLMPVTVAKTTANCGFPAHLTRVP